MKNFIKNFLCFTDFLNLVHSVPALGAWICWSQAGLLVLHMLQLHVVLLFGLQVIISLFCFLLFSISSVAILTERSLVPGFILAVKPSWTLRLHLKTRQPKAKPEPWFNDSCCQEEMSQSTPQIGKIKLQVSFYILKDCRCHYCNAIKKPKKKYSANIISSKGHNSHVSFNTTDSVLNAPQNVCLSFS